MVLGLELLETLTIVFTEHRLRLELILIVAIIAVSRHIILLDLDHVDGVSLLGIGALVISFSTAYFLFKRAAEAAPPEETLRGRS